MTLDESIQGMRLHVIQRAQVGGVSACWCSSITVPRGPACSPSARGRPSGACATARRGTSSPSARASWSAWTPFTSASSRASARSGRSRPANAASSYGVARILPALAHTAVTHFLRQVLLPAVRRAGWSLQRVLTDGGGEFKASFDEARTPPRNRHTPIKPPHGWATRLLAPPAPHLPPPPRARGGGAPA